MEVKVRWEGLNSTVSSTKPMSCADRPKRFLASHRSHPSTWETITFRVLPRETVVRAAVSSSRRQIVGLRFSFTRRTVYGATPLKFRVLQIPTQVDPVPFVRSHVYRRESAALVE